MIVITKRSLLNSLKTVMCHSSFGGEKMKWWRIEKSKKKKRSIIIRPALYFPPSIRLKKNGGKTKGFESILTNYSCGEEV